MVNAEQGSNYHVKGLLKGLMNGNTLYPYPCFQVKLAENFNGADLRNICTEAGMFAIRDERDYTVHDDFMKAVRKLVEAKKLESTLSYDSSFGDGGKQ